MFVYDKNIPALFQLANTLFYILLMNLLVKVSTSLSTLLITEFFTNIHVGFGEGCRQTLPQPCRDKKAVIDKQQLLNFSLLMNHLVQQSVSFIFSCLLISSKVFCCNFMNCVSSFAFLLYIACCVFLKVGTP